MSISTWTGDISSDWVDPGNWSPAAVPGAGSDVVIAAGAPVAVASASIGTVNSITDSSDLSFESAGTNTVATFLDNTGSLHVDDSAGAGGTSLNIGGTLTNSRSLTIGNATLSAPDTVTAASLDNTATGKIHLTGSSAIQALLDVTGSAGFGAAGALSGYVQLIGDSAIEFTSGQITSLAASAQLHLNGSDAFIEDSKAQGSNSALTGLASIGAGAIFALHNKAAVSTTGSLANDGHIRLDFDINDGGSSLTVGGTLTNSNTLRIGNELLTASDKVTAAALDNTGFIALIGEGRNRALLDVTHTAGFGTAGVLSGDVRVVGDSAIEFTSGLITSLAANAQLHLNDEVAFVEDSTAPGSNSALRGLASIGAGAIFGIHNQAAVSTSGSLANDGHVNLDFDRGDGGSSLTLAGALTNSGSFNIGNATLSRSDEVTAASLDNTGSITLTGSGLRQALLDVTDSAGFGAAGVLSGNVDLSHNSAIEFTSGEITGLAANAQLHLDGSHALIEDSTKLGSNSALTGLASIGAGALLELQNGASVSTTGALAGDGTIFLDANDGNRGGSNLTVAGALTNSIELEIGTSTLSASDKVTAASLDNTGFIGLTGSGANQALLDVTGSAGFGTAGVFSGRAQLLENSAIEFASGQISTIAASSQLEMSGNSAIEDSTALGSNSALTGLADIAGSLFLEDGVSLSTSESVTDSGHLNLDYSYGLGGSTLSIGGALTNTGALDIGAVSSSSSVTAASFVNSGKVDLGGNGTAFASLGVSGATTNSGAISIATDSEELAGAVGGAGSFSLSTANLQFDSSVSAGQTIIESGANDLILEQAQNFAATISGFGTGDTIDATNFHAPPATTYSFLENSAMTGGTLTLTDTSLSLTANILMTGDYSNSSFTLAHDSGTGTLVKFV
jgi:hypothetical protein